MEGRREGRTEMDERVFAAVISKGEETAGIDSLIHNFRSFTCNFSGTDKSKFSHELGKM